MNIAGVEIGGPCRFVAELGNAHNGSLDRAIRLLDAAKESGADFAKLQLYTPDELIALRGDSRPPAPWDHMTMRELYSKAMTPASWIPALFSYAEWIGLPIFSSVFGLQSLAVLESVNCPAYKLASLDRGATWLFNAIARTKKPLIVSRPDFPDLSADATLLCPPGYPQTEGFRPNEGFDGFSYHGTDNFVPKLAADNGASIIECHFQLDSEPSELERGISLTASQFRELVDAVRYDESGVAA